MAQKLGVFCSYHCRSLGVTLSTTATRAHIYPLRDCQLVLSSRDDSVANNPGFGPEGPDLTLT